MWQCSLCQRRDSNIPYYKHFIFQCPEIWHLLILYGFLVPLTSTHISRSCCSHIRSIRQSAMDSSQLPPGTDISMIPSLSPPPGVVPNFLDPDNLEGPILAVSITACVLAFALLSARLYSTTRLTKSFGLDDGAAVIALAFSVSYAGLIISTRDRARHGWDLPITKYTPSFFKIIFAETVIGAVALLFSKLSILFLYFRLFAPNRRFRYFIYNGILWTALISTVTIIVACTLCVPRGGEAFATLKSARRCEKQKYWSVVQGVLTMILDFYILYLPIPIIWNLQMGQRRKIGVLSIFLTGFVYDLLCDSKERLLIWSQCLYRKHVESCLQNRSYPEHRFTLERFQS